MAIGIHALTTRRSRTADEAFAQFEKRGFAPVLSGRIAGSNFYMMDASDLLGRMVEVAGGPLSTIEWTDSPP